MTTSPLSRIATRLFNVPLALHPAKAEIIMAALAERLGIANLTRLNGEIISLEQSALYDRSEPRSGRVAQSDPGYDLAGNVAVIPIHGTLVQKTGALRPVCGMTGFDGIRQSFLSAIEDSGVQAIVLDVDSPGGEVAGCFDLVDAIYNARGDKPIHAILSETAYSAAYALASAADRITVPRTGGTGSIGVVCMHVDWSRALSGAGLKVTFIQYGDRKADGRPEIPLSKEAFAAFQEQIDTMGELFVETVARNRDMSTREVREMEAATYLGSAGVEQGLVDRVAAPDAAFRALLAELD